MRVRLTRFQWALGSTVAASLLIVAFSQGTLRWVLLSVLFSLAGLYVGLGACFPYLQVFGQSLCEIRTRRKVVALTFDDGPEPLNTPRLLDLLASRGVRATFFCVGQRVARHPELARRIAAEGHLVENHSYLHSSWMNLFSVERLRADLTQAQEEIARVTGRRPTFFRPPSFLTNPRVFRVVRELNLTVAAARRLGLDRQPNSAERIAARVLRGVRPGGIILLHDGGVPADRLLAVVTTIIDKLQADGYECLRLDELVSCEEK